jgi:hypothetical protein
MLEIVVAYDFHPYPVRCGLPPLASATGSDEIVSFRYVLLKRNLSDNLLTRKAEVSSDI